MKRALIALLILATGTTVFCAFRNATTNVRQDVAIQRAAWQMQTQQIARLHFEQHQLLERLSETKRILAAQPSLPPLEQLANKVLSGASLQNLSAAESEQLLAELGFNWNTTGDYIIVSKKSLDGISFAGMKGATLTTAAIETLAITPDEQATIEKMTQQLNDARAAWDKEHVQRIEPSGNVLAQYTLPANTELSQSQLAVFTNGIFNVLGEQRGQWLEDHSLQWMQDAELLIGPDLSKIPPEFLATMSVADYQAQPTVLTLKRHQAGDGINFTLQQAGNSMTTTVNPWQPFPTAFHAVFPGGWKELAEREGFELPKEFINH